MRLENRTALITGAGSGMGREAALLFAGEGATVVVVDLDLEAAESTVATIASAGGAAVPLQCDVSQVDRLRAVFATVEDRFGVLHVLYNHAGIPGPGSMDVAEDDWDRAVNVNLKSAFYATAFGIPLLQKAERKGSIIFTASTSGLVGSPLSPHYAMTKGGIVLLMKSVALRYASEGIRANAICPGPVETPMLPTFFGRTPGASQIDDEIRGFVAAAVPMGRPGQPSEIASTALFLASDDSSFITGVALPVDGGYVARADAVLTDAETITPAVRALIGTPGSCIGGTWLTDGDDEIEVVDPATEEVIARVPTLAPAKVEEAVSAARKASDDGPWPTMHPRERQAAINRLADRLEANHDALVDLGVVEIGSPVTLSRGLHASGPVTFFRWWAEMALRGPNGSYQHGLGLHEQPVLSSSILFHEPVGVVAGLIAYNYPMMLKGFKIGGALAAGCTTVIMPSPRTPLASVAFMRIAEEAELPPGVVNLVIGGPAAGQALTESDGVDMVSFTGSVKVGRQVMIQAARGLKKVVLELGGKSPNVLLPGADVEAAVLPSLLRFTRASGQGCGCTTRILVHRSDHERFLEAARSAMDSLVVADPWDDRTDIGPLIRPEHLQSVEAYVERALAGGAEIVAGGRPHGLERGYYMSPALVGSVANDAEICQEELFGPIGVVIPYDTVDEAVALANATRYGLNASIWGPTDEAMGVARRIRSGTVALNGGGGERPDAPWSGYGESSIGSERGEAGFAEFFQVKHVQWPLASGTR